MPAASAPGTQPERLEPVTIGDPNRRLSGRGALLVVALVLGTIAAARFGFGWIEAHSDDWSLASAQRVLAEAPIAADVRSGLAAEVARLAAAHEAGTLDHDGLFPTLQRLVEGSLVPVAMVQAAAATPGLAVEDAAVLTDLAATLAPHEHVPAMATPLLDELRRGAAPASLVARAREVLAQELEPLAPGAPFDVVAAFRGLVDKTLAGEPPKRFPPQ